MHPISPLFFVLVAFIWHVRSDSKFLTPLPQGNGGWSDNTVYGVGEQMSIQWETDLNSTQLTLWQRYPLASGGALPYYYLQLTNLSRSTSYIWRANLDGFTAETPGHVDVVFELDLYSSDNDTDPVAVSQPFNVTTYYPKSKTPLSSKAAAGIAVGSTIGGILILGAWGFLAWKWLRKRRTSGKMPDNEQVGPEQVKLDRASQQTEPPEPYKPELQDTRRVELAGQQRLPTSQPQPQSSLQGPGGLHEVP